MASFRIGRLAELSGVSRDTLRYYERLGLLGRPSRTDGGYRIYADQAVKRLQVICNARRFGFSLAEIREFMKVREAGGAPCVDVRAAAERRLREVDAQIHELTALRRAMRTNLKNWNAKLAAVPAGTPARLLEGSSSLPDVSRRRRLHRS